MIRKKCTLILFLILIVGSIRTFSSNNFVKINCQIKSNELNIGDAMIVFFSVNNKKYSFKSNSLGKAIANIPEGKYRISVFRNDKEIAERSYEGVFSHGKEYKLELNLENTISGASLNEEIGRTYGFVYDEDKNNISDVIIAFKTSNDIKSVKSDKNGTFDAILPLGTTIITASKSGYLDSSIILEVKKGFPMTNVEIVLRKNRYILEGIITDGVRAIKSIRIAIYDSDFNQINETQTDQYGHYEFLDIRGYDRLYISIDNSSYVRYQSELLTFSEKNNIMNIILEKK